MSANDATYYLRWRGQQHGPLSLEGIRAGLADGQVGLLHEILVGGRWKTLGEFFQEADQHATLEKAAQAQQAQADQQRRVTAQKDAALQDAQRQNEMLASQLEALQREAARRPNAPSPPPPPGYSPASQNRPLPGPPSYQPGFVTHSGLRQQTSGTAIAAFVASLLNFVPVINFVAWLAAIILGHIALADIKRTPGLGGHGLALAALIITYVLLAIGLLFGLFIGLSRAGGVRF